MTTTDTEDRIRRRPDDEDADIYDEDGNVRGDFLALVGAAIADRDTLFLRQNVARLHESEIGDLLESIQPDQRLALVRLLGDDFDMTALTEVDEAIRREIVDQMPNAQIAAAIGELDSDDAVYILEDLDKEDREEILAQLPFTERVRLRRALDYPESSAGRRMQTEFVAVPPFWTVGQTIDYMRDEEDLPYSFSQIFVIDPTFKLLGAVDLDQILRTKRQTKIEQIMRETNHPVPAEMDQEEAAQLFEQYDLLSAAVVDENGRLVGVLTIDDVVDVIHEEADEDIKRLGGVGDEELSDNVLDGAFALPVAFDQSRHGDAVGKRHRPVRRLDREDDRACSADADRRFDGWQCRHADDDGDGARARHPRSRHLQCRPHHPQGGGRRHPQRHCLRDDHGRDRRHRFHDYQLGGVIAAAMIINLIAAALAGILLPLLLDKMGADPAIASSVFVTTVTDCTGFFAFLGIATWWFGI